MNMTLFQVDAFTNQPFAGNPAAVCLLSEAQDESWMRLVAREMNLSETAFVHRQDDGFSLRWFTPLIEVDLCGHATLATAHVLWESGWLESSAAAEFHTLSGILYANRNDDKTYLDFPSQPPAKCDLPDGLAESLGVTPVWTGRNKADYFIQLESAEHVRRAAPDFVALGSIQDCRGVIVTAAGDNDDFDFVSRFFAPAAGIDEDPVTGSAHTCLAP